MKATTNLGALVRQNKIEGSGDMTGAEIALVSAIAMLVALIVVLLVGSSLLVGSALIVWAAAGCLGYYWIGQGSKTQTRD